MIVKMKIALFLIVVLAIFGVALWLRYGGVTHGEISAAVNGCADRIERRVDAHSDELKSRLDVRCSALEAKLDRIESKLDRLLEIARRPLPDGLKEVK